MIKKPISVYTDHFASKKISSSFAKGINGKMVHVKQLRDHKKSIAVYGYLRGLGDIINKSKDFWYIDHGYFNSSKRNFSERATIISSFDGYFKVVHNSFWHIGKGSCNLDRLEKLNINFKAQRKIGDYIILSEPIKAAVDFHKLHDWNNSTIREIRKFSDRKIILHNRNSPIKLVELLINAWALVSDHSNAGIIAMINGVPAHYTNKKLQSIGKIKDIECGVINYKIFSNLAYGQWTLEEMKSGEAWDFLKNDLIE